MAEMSDAQLEQLREHCEIYCSRRQYKLHELLGYGGSASVFRVEAASGDIAVKVYLSSFLAGAAGDAERRRIELQRGLIGHSCPSLVQLYLVSYEQETCFIEMEYFPWKDLSRVLGDVPRQQIYPLIGQLVEAVEFLETKTLVHRDIKPANILISPDYDRIVVIDLGVVREASGDEDRSDNTDHGLARPFIATAQYSSPEYLFRTLPPSADLWRALTVYQVGGVLHDLIVRAPLFDQDTKTGNRYAVALAVQQKMPSLDSFEDVPIELRALALHCLAKNPNRRLLLVSWDRFVPPSKDLKGLQSRLSMLKETQEKRHAQQHELQKQELVRRDFAYALFDGIHKKMRGNFPEIQLEKISADQGTSRCIFRFHLPSGVWAVDASVDVIWPKPGEGADTQTEVTAQGMLVRSAAAATFRKGQVVAVVSPGSENVETHVFSVIDAIGEILAKALNVLELDEPDVNEVQLGD